MEFVVRNVSCRVLLIVQPIDQWGLFVIPGTLGSFVFFLMDEHRNSLDSVAELILALPRRLGFHFFALKSRISNWGRFDVLS
jgi:hypothetical protein